MNIFQAIRTYVITFIVGFSLILSIMALIQKASAAPPTVRVQEATIGQQDRSLTVDPSRFKGYDNSDFLRDMEEIRRNADERRRDNRYFLRNINRER